MGVPMKFAEKDTQRRDRRIRLLCGAVAHIALFRAAAAINAGPLSCRHGRAGWTSGCRRGGRPQGVFGLLQGSSTRHEQGGPHKKRHPASRDVRLSPPKAFMLANVSVYCACMLWFGLPAAELVWEPQADQADVIDGPMPPATTLEPCL